MKDKTKLSIGLLLFGIILSFIFFYFGYTYAMLKMQNLAEDELLYDDSQLMLLDKYRNVPDCVKVISSKNIEKIYSDKNVVIIWRFDPDNNILMKLIIDNELNVTKAAHQIKNMNGKCSIIDIGGQ